MSAAAPPTPVHAPGTESNIVHEGDLGDKLGQPSSGQGVSVLPLEGGWLGDQFASGRARG